MSGMPEEPSIGMKEERYKTKTVRVRNGDGTVHTIMITKFYGDNNEALSKIGYGGDYIMFNFLDTFDAPAHTDPHKLVHDVPFMDRESLSWDVMAGIYHDESSSSISFVDLVDGEIIDLERFKELKE